MWIEHLELLRCPKTRRRLLLKNETRNSEGRIESGILHEPESGNEYPIVGFIPRFVPKENYAQSFGFQWNLHRLTQHDHHSGLKASEVRFWKETGWERDLSGQKILEAGSGSGRFTRYPVEAGATVVSFDYSNAVEANFKANGHRRNLLLIQADIFQMPFEEEFFDKVFCFGVLQHTPDPRKAFQSLVSVLRKGGRIATDIYLKSFLNYYLNPYYYVRTLTRGRNPESLYQWVKGWVDFMWPMVRVFRKIPRLGEQINRRILMVADHSNQFPDANDKTLKEWAYLDTFDWLSPAFDQPQTPREFEKWHQSCGLTGIEVHRGYNGVEGRAWKSGQGRDESANG